MTRTEALQFVEAGHTLIKDFLPADHPGLFDPLQIWIRKVEICSFSRRRLWEHTEIGPYELRFWSGGNPHWIHISKKQLLNFIDRNY